MICKAEFLGKPHDVGIHGNPLNLATRVSQNNVCALARDSGKRKQLLHGIWHLAAKLSVYDSCRLKYTFCFCPVKSRGLNILFKLLDICIYIIRKSSVLFEKLFANFVHFFVGALGGKAHRNQKFPSIGILENYLGIRKQLPKFFHYLLCQFFALLHYSTITCPIALRTPVDGQ